MTNLNDPAFPGPGEVFTTDASGTTLPQGAWGLNGAAGLTKRELFAAMAMQGLMDSEEGGSIEDAERELGIPVGTYSFRNHWPMIIARRACAYADALIAELNKPASEKAAGE